MSQVASAQHSPDRAVREGPDRQLFWLAAGATLLGLCAIASAGFARSVHRDQGIVTGEAHTQAIAIVAALLVALWVSRWRATAWRRLAPWFFLACAGAVLAVKFIGIERNGAQRWIDLGPFHAQPSEFAKLGVVLFLAWVLARREPWTGPKRPVRGVGEWLDHVAVPKIVRSLPLLTVISVVVMVEREPDLGTAAVIAVAALVMLVAGGVTWKSLAMLGVLGSIGVAWMVLQEPYRIDRIATHMYRWEELHRDDVGFQTTQSEMAMASGGLAGVGAGAGRARHMLPAATSDFIMTTIAEDFGLVGALTVLAILGLLVRRLLVVASRVPDGFGKLVLCGVAAWIAVQTCVNVAMANGALPAIGLPLPFISAGGSSLAALWLAIGVCLAISRTAARPAPIRRPEALPA
jgi:cell division protein FtsW